MLQQLLKLLQRNKHYKNRINPKITLTLLLFLAILSVGSTVLVSYRIISNLILNYVRKEALLEAEETANTIDGWLFERISKVKLIANSPLTWKHIIKPSIPIKNNVQLIKLKTQNLYVSYAPLPRINWFLVTTTPKEILEKKLYILNILAVFITTLLLLSFVVIFKQFQLLNQAHNYSRQQALLNRLTEHIRQSLDLQTVLNTTVEEVAKLLDLERVSFNWYHPERQILEVVCEYKQENLPSHIACWDIKYFGDLVESLGCREIVAFESISKHPDLSEGVKQAYLQIGAESYLALPVSDQEHASGYVICTSSKARLWSDYEIQLFEALKDQLAIAINQSCLYAQTQEQFQAVSRKSEQLRQALEELHDTQAQLIQKEKMSSLGQLVAGIAHEINNPINFIHGNIIHTNEYTQGLLDLVELYQEEYPNSSERIAAKIVEIELAYLVADLPKVLSSMQAGAERIRQIVLSLRNFSRLDEAEMKPVNIHEGIDNTLLILQNRLQGNQKSDEIEVIKKYGNLPEVECYPGQLNQVFMNILANAVDVLENFNQELLSEDEYQQKTITIHTQVKNMVGNKVNLDESSPVTTYPLALIPFIMISIKDNGSGMTPEIQERIFDPFFSTKPIGKGTGLGLSISYQTVVDKHGGSLKCFSKPGKGSEFIIEIPVKQSSRQYLD